MIHIHNGILLSHKKEQNNAICNYMDKPRSYQTKWSKPDRERQILIMQNLIFKKYKKTYKTETHRLWKTYGYQSRQVGVGGRYGLGVWDWHMYPETYGMTDQWEHAI